MIKKIKSLSDLETGIKHLLLENRCSFSDEEKILLDNCIVVINQAKDKEILSIYAKILDILSKVFIASEHLKNLF